MTERGVRLRTYAQVWRLERVIYQVEGISLPFAVTVQQVGVFAGSIGVMILLTNVLPGFSGLGVAIRYVALPALITWFLTKQTLDGKAPHRWLWGMLRFLTMPKRLNRFEPMPSGTRRQIRAYATFGGKD